MLSQTQHQHRIEEICCGKIVNLAITEQRDISINSSQLSQLLEEGLSNPNTAYNSQPTFKEYLLLADKLSGFLFDNIKLRLTYKGTIARQLPPPSA